MTVVRPGLKRSSAPSSSGSSAQAQALTRTSALSFDPLKASSIFESPYNLRLFFFHLSRFPFSFISALKLVCLNFEVTVPLSSHFVCFCGVYYKNTGLHLRNRTNRFPTIPHRNQFESTLAPRKYGSIARYGVPMVRTKRQPLVDSHLIQTYCIC